MQHTHERLASEQAAVGHSPRSFGLVFGGFFVIVGLWPVIEGEWPRSWAIVVALVFVILAIVRPGLLSPFSRAWMAFGELLHRVVTPVVMGVLFYVFLTPIALLMRLLRKRPIPIDFDTRATSYWIKRDPPGPASDTMKNQF